MFHLAGLHGEGEIIGVADSGLDYNSCFFSDPSMTPPAQGKNNLYPDARKVVQYVAYADNKEGEDGTMHFIIIKLNIIYYFEAFISQQ
jgi:hypothetical protein